MIHAGWRGLAGGVARRGRRALRELGATATLARGDRPGRRGLLLRGRGRGPRRVRAPTARRRARGEQRRPQGVARRQLAARRRRRGPRRRPLHDVRAARPVLLAPPRRRRGPAARRASCGASLRRGTDGRADRRASTPSACARTSPRCASGSPRPRRARARRGADVEIVVGGQVRRARRTSACSPRPASRSSARTARRTSQAKVAAYGDAFTLGLHRPPAEPQGQGRRAARAADPLGRHGLRARAARPPRARRACEVLVEVNVAGEEGKSGVAPAELDAFLERCPVPVAGLMTMPPRAERPEDSRRWFAALRELADDARPARAVDGHDAGLRGRRRGGRDDRAHRHEAPASERLQEKSRPRSNLSHRPWRSATAGIARSSTSASPRSARTSTSTPRSASARAARAPARARAPVAGARARGRDRGRLPRAPERAPPRAAPPRRDEFDDIFADDEPRAAAARRPCCAPSSARRATAATCACTSSSRSPSTTRSRSPTSSRRRSPSSSTCRAPTPTSPSG